MSRTIRLLTCLLLILAMAAAPAALASPAESASSPWWTVLSDLWSKVVAAATASNDGTNRGPEIDPDGPALTNSDVGDGETTPEIDPDGLTANPPGDGSHGGEILGNNGRTTPEIDPNG